MKSSRISRVIQLLAALQSGQPYTAGSLSEILNISRRMVFRDLKELKQIGVPYYFDNKVRHYKIDPKFFLSTPNLNMSEALGLFLLTHKIRGSFHFPLENSALMAALKIESSLPDKVKRFCRAALEKISIKANPQEKLNLLDQKFIIIVEATLKNRVITINYQSPAEQKSIAINLCPYHLMYNKHAWYVLGITDIEDKVCIFNFNHIKELNILHKCFIEDKAFDLSECLGRAWSMVAEGRLYHIKLRFSPEVHSVADVQWHSTQTVTPQDDGSVIIEFRVDGLNEITWWVLSYGDRVQVLAPKALQQRVIEIAQNMVKQNSQLSSI